MGPNPAAIDPEKGYKPPQKLTFVCKISGTSTKKRTKCPSFSDFPVPPIAWDKTGTTVGHGTEEMKNPEFGMQNSDR